MSRRRPTEFVAEALGRISLPKGYLEELRSKRQDAVKALLFST